MVSQHAWRTISDGPNLLLAGTEVEVCLGDGDPIKEDVDCDSNEERTMTVKTTLDMDICRSKELNARDLCWVHLANGWGRISHSSSPLQRRYK